jgi:hypothetical protein
LGKPSLVSFRSSPAQLQKGKEMGLDEAAQAEPVRRSEVDTHPIVEPDKVDASGCNIAKAFRSGRFDLSLASILLNLTSKTVG